MITIGKWPTRIQSRGACDSFTPSDRLLKRSSLHLPSWWRISLH